MCARRLLALAVLVGCGRFGFDSNGTGDGGPGSGDARDSGPPAETRILPILGAGFVHDAAFDPAGNLAVIGDFMGNVTIGGMTMPTSAAAQDMFVAVLDPTSAATRLWTGGATQFGSGQNIAWLPDGSLAASGYFSGTLTNGGNLVAGSRQAALVATFDPAGTLAFSKHYGASSNVQARGSDATADRLAVVGIYSGSVDFGAGALPATAADNGFVATMDLGSTDVRSRAFTGGGDIYVNDVKLGPGGDVFLGGRFNATTDFGLAPISPQPGGSTAFVGRFDAQLVPRWVRTFGNAITVTNVEVFSNGDCVAVGELGGTIMIDGITVTKLGVRDGWVARFAGADGTVAWIRTLAGGSSGIIPSVTLTSDRVVIAGEFSGTVQVAGTQTLTSDGATDAVIAGLELDGTLAWTRQVGGTGSVVLGLGGISVDPTGTLVAVAVDASGELTVDGQAFTLGTTDGAVILVAIPR